MQHLINKTNLRETKWHQDSPPELAENQVRLALEAFALTANNVTYATFGGPPMHYWDFFPCSVPQYGRVPVWGFARIIASEHEGLEVGRRVYGYFPMSSTLDVQPARLSAQGFVDGSPHRQALSMIYNTYVFTDADPAYDGAYEAEQMLFRPLYLTGWMICDSLMQGEALPDTVILSSASSKTALATAHGLHRRGITTIGLSSAANADFVSTSGLYSQVLTYDELSGLPDRGAIAYVDFVGRPSLTKTIHQTCGPALQRSLMIGATDWEADRQPVSDLPGPVPEFFFVPAYAAERTKQMPKGALESAMLKDLLAFYPISRTLVSAETIHGENAISQAWINLVNGQIDPRRGLICQLQG